MKRIAAGDLRTLVRIQMHTETRRGDGSVIYTPSTIQQAWAAVRPLTGKEFMDGQAVNSLLTHRVEIRWMRDITPSCRILWTDRAGKARILGITSILDSEEMGTHMILMCQELKA